MEEGYLLCVFGGETYFKLSDRIIQNIFKFDSTRKICILTDNLSYYHTKNNNIIVKYFDYNNHLNHNIDCKNDWNKYGFIPKIHQYKYTPFNKTCFMDVDMLFFNDFTFIWEEFKNSSSPILIGGKSDINNRSPPNWHWNGINMVMQKCGFNCPQICSTIFIYETEFMKTLNQPAEYILNNFKNWNVRSLFENGYPDEIYYSILLGMNKIYPSKLIDEWFYDKNNCDSCNKKI